MKIQTWGGDALHVGWIGMKPEYPDDRKWYIVSPNRKNFKRLELSFCMVEGKAFNTLCYGLPSGIVTPFLLTTVEEETFLGMGRVKFLEKEAVVWKNRFRNGGTVPVYTPQKAFGMLRVFPKWWRWKEKADYFLCLFGPESSLNDDVIELHATVFSRKMGLARSVNWEH
jgi:hypothetical protein